MTRFVGTVADRLLRLGILLPAAMCAIAVTVIPGEVGVLIRTLVVAFAGFLLILWFCGSTAKPLGQAKEVTGLLMLARNSARRKLQRRSGTVAVLGSSI